MSFFAFQFPRQSFATGGENFQKKIYRNGLTQAMESFALAREEPSYAAGSNRY